MLREEDTKELRDRLATGATEDTSGIQDQPISIIPHDASYTDIFTPLMI